MSKSKSGLYGVRYTTQHCEFHLPRRMHLVLPIEGCGHAEIEVSEVRWRFVTQIVLRFLKAEYILPFASPFKALRLAT